MKKPIHFVLSVFFILLVTVRSSAQLFPNPGFENWSVGSQGFLDPDGWISINYPPDPCVVQTPGHTGNFAVKLTSIQDSASQIITGGEIDYFGAINIKPLTISGYWKYLNAGTLDGIFIDMNVYSQSSVIGTLSAHTPGASLSNWTPFSENVAYGPTGFPDYFTITIQFRPTSTTSINGYGSLDDLSMTYLAGIDTVVAQFPAANVLPGATPDKYRLFIDLFSGTTMIAQIFDLQGKMLNTQTTNLPNGHHEIPVDFSEYKVGQYLYVVTLGNKPHQFKINKL